MKKTIFLPTLPPAWVLAGCTTVQGVRKAGETIEAAAVEK